MTTRPLADRIPAIMAARVLDRSPLSGARLLELRAAIYSLAPLGHAESAALEAFAAVGDWLASDLTFLAWRADAQKQETTPTSLADRMLANIETAAGGWMISPEFVEPSTVEHVARWIAAVLARELLDAGDGRGVGPVWALAVSEVEFDDAELALVYRNECAGDLSLAIQQATRTDKRPARPADGKGPTPPVTRRAAAVLAWRSIWYPKTPSLRGQRAAQVVATLEEILERSGPVTRPELLGVLDRCRKIGAVLYWRALACSRDLRGEVERKAEPLDGAESFVRWYAAGKVTA